MSFSQQLSSQLHRSHCILCASPSSPSSSPSPLARLRCPYFLAQPSLRTTAAAVSLQRSSAPSSECPLRSETWWTPSLICPPMLSEESSRGRPNLVYDCRPVLRTLDVT
ncbi:hypothetical protein FA95DRAFT_1389157 [Auriscalpium vulgare]|uniref:Uncharacterized protein n=1 Tax=Auriscalpium vulgare TaxID=40419 RepID=A0ACB8S858_9AGAM|nr:hypothetical protein FA95DRAFT_1389157 [Auriscalpium vulgare]